MHSSSIVCRSRLSRITSTAVLSDGSISIHFAPRLWLFLLSRNSLTSLLSSNLSSSWFGLHSDTWMSSSEMPGTGSPPLLMLFRYSCRFSGWENECSCDFETGFICVFGMLLIISLRRLLPFLTVRAPSSERLLCEETCFETFLGPFSLFPEDVGNVELNVEYGDCRVCPMGGRTV